MLLAQILRNKRLLSVFNFVTLLERISRPCFLSCSFNDFQVFFPTLALCTSLPLLLSHYTKMKLSIKDFFSKCDLVTFTEEIRNAKLFFLGGGGGGGEAVIFVSRFTFCTQRSPTWSCMYQVTGSSRPITQSGSFTVPFIMNLS